MRRLSCRWLGKQILKYIIIQEQVQEYTGVSISSNLMMVIKLVWRLFSGKVKDFLDSRMSTQTVIFTAM